MKIQTQPDYLIFAQDAKTSELQEFPDVSRGWGVTIDQTQSKPPMEWMNGAFNRVDKNMLYLLQQGIPQWNSDVLYPVGAVIKYNNTIYLAKLENDNAMPSTNTSKWDKLLNDASTTQKGIVKLSSATNSPSETEAATTKAVKVAYDSASSANAIANTAKSNALTAQIKADSAYTLANNANITADTALSRTLGGVVSGNTNFTGKLKQAGSDVITVESIYKYNTTLVSVLYPEGSESSPPILSKGNRKVIANPYNTLNCIVKLELRINNIWAECPKSQDTGSNYTRGATATAMSNGTIVIQCGGVSLLTGAQGDGNPWNSGLVESAPYRVRVIKLSE
ncbi:tail fiber-like repeat protein [Orbus hercynius]|uniref:Tail fiber-like repeat protein n=1 Tax=Orbus hercynius TaxID=593135 RepID=A0A495RHF3_9GAMM|nr:tail fiber protein [Orbus hercynius]RKS86922.1 tail fiber-like repeat protein [Orbus hercynius]